MAEVSKADAVFEGGGVKGIGLVGALSVAEEKGYIEWENVAGTSAGAIVASLVAARYRATEIKEIMDGLDPDDLPVAHAVRMSMSIPFFYEPVRLRGKDGKESYVVDGGLLSNYPVSLFDSPAGEVPAWPTFGFRLIEGDPGSQAPYHEINGPLTMLAALFFTAMEAHDAKDIEDQDWVRTMFIPTLGVSSTNFDLDRDTSERLYQSGRQAAVEFFSTWKFQNYIDAYRRDGSRHGRKLAKQQLLD